ncbi:MAG: hypothetical protein PHO20_05965 [Candidatus Peribacteraceae bacterium]|nr:hypothetical protein [Candidatus Peribacteraceae bacterium]MDD5740282.1 hypothetical protein [Candidatus Peribacteraceae bacterium]
MRPFLLLDAVELGEVLRNRTSRRVSTLLFNGSDFPWFPEGFALPLGIDKNDYPRHLCEEERVIRGVTLVFPIVFWDCGSHLSRGVVNVFRPYWIEWLAIHDWMLPPDQQEWRDGTMIEGVCAIAQTPAVGSLRCHDCAWHQTSGQLYLRDGKVVADCIGSGAFHHRMYVRRLHYSDPPRELRCY